MRSADARQDPWLHRWLTERQQAFPGWAAATGPGNCWDFTPESLDRLERLVRERIDDSNRLEDRADTFAQGAIFYVGEVGRRHRGAHWEYLAIDPDDDAGPHSLANPYAGDPYVIQDGPDAGVVMPLMALTAVVDRPGDGVLRERFDALDEDLDPEQDQLRP